MLLCLLLTAGCTPAEPSAAELPAEQVPTAEQLAASILDACGRSADELERTDRLLDEAGLSAYLTNYYGLEQDSWRSCAIYRAGGAQAFEIAVLELDPGADTDAVPAGLNAYISAREGDFTGYAPDQAALVSQSRTVHASVSLQDGSVLRFAALLICEDPAAAEAAFSAFFQGGVQSVSPSPVSTPPEDVSPSPSESGAPVEPAPPASSPVPTQEASPAQPSPQQSPSPSSSPSPAQPVTYPGREDYIPPGIDDMTVCDTSAILSARDSGDPSSLSDRDRAVYDLCRQILEDLLTDDMSDYDKEYAVYRYLASAAAYDEDHYDALLQMDPASYTPYGVLVNGKGVCLGFATTFRLFMDLCGVECITVVGAAFHSQEDHAWNMVRLDGEWYCVDLTWDLGARRFRYFNVTSDYMALTGHQWDYDQIPEATAAGGGRQRKFEPSP